MTSRPSGTVTPQSGAQTPTPTTAVTLKSWEDPAGFTMKYPDTLSMDKHDEDKTNYAHVELTDPAHPGRVVVWVKDLPKGITDTLSWSKSVATGSAISFDTTIGGKPAKKILIPGPPKAAVTGIVWDGVLWLAEADLTDEAYWQGVYTAVTDSFAFVPLPTEPAAAAGTYQDAAVDEEEVLE